MLKNKFKNQEPRQCENNITKGRSNEEGLWKEVQGCNVFISSAKSQTLSKG